MAFDLTTYQDPGVYQAEVIVPNGANVTGQPFALALIGTGSRSKRVVNEAVQRGRVAAEAVTFSGSPAQATLAARALRRTDTTVVHKLSSSGVSTIIPDTYVSFPAATISGLAGTFTFTANSADSFALQLDGKVAIVIRFVSTSGTPGTVTQVGGTEFHVETGASLATISRSTVASYINAVLTDARATALGYGSAYSAAASGAGSLLTITSPLTTAASDVRVFESLAGAGGGTANTGAVVLFGSATKNAATVVQVANAAYDNTATYTVDYVLAADVDTKLDALANTQVERVLAVGAYQNAGNYSSGTDWQQKSGSGTAASITTGAAVGQMRLTGLTGLTAGSVGGLLTVSGAASSPSNGTFVIASYISATSCDVINTLFTTAPDANNGSIAWTELRSAIDWSLATAAAFTGTGFVAPTTTSTGTFTLSLDGKRDVVIDTYGASVQPQGYVNHASAVADVAGNINAVLANDAAYGSRYEGVATVVSGQIKLTSPTLGVASSITIKTTGAYTGASGLLGLSSSAAPSTTGATYSGTGQAPGPGAVYFTSYEYIRPASEYAVPYRFFSADEAYSQVGQLSSRVANYNPLAQAVQIAFANGAQVVYTIQVDDAAPNTGAPLRSAVDACLDAAKVLSSITEVITLGSTDDAVMADLMVHVEQECAPTEKHYRRGWFGVAAGINVGDGDTAGTIVYRAKRSLQPAPASPARGRYFLVTPPQKAGVTKTLTLEDGTSVRRTLDSSYLAVAVAALKTSAGLGPADSLVRRTIIGFNTDDITAPWAKAERALMASAGALVVTYDAGVLRLLDPVTTEAGGGGLIQFKQDSSSYQKDNLTTKIDAALNANIVGIVPFDLANFIIDIKLIIAGEITGAISAGAIGPYRDDVTGAVRAIDMKRDIIVTQSKADPTKFYFKYWYNLRYPALRLVGEWSVDNPFWSRST